MRKRLTYANVIATLALFFALTGGAMAAGKYLLSTDTIPATSDLGGSTYGSPIIASGKVTTAKLADGAVTSSKFDGAATAPNASKLGGQPPTAYAREIAQGSFTSFDTVGAGLCADVASQEVDTADFNTDFVDVTPNVLVHDFSNAAAVVSGEVTDVFGGGVDTPFVDIFVCNFSSSSLSLAGTTFRYVVLR